MMKRYLLAIFVTLLAFASCTKGLESDPVDDNTPIDNNAINQVTTVLTFSGERPQLDPSTKTEWNGEHIVWSASDKIRIGFTFNNDWWGQTEAFSSDKASPNNRIKFYQSNEVAIDSENPSVGTFTVPTNFEAPTTSGDFNFYAIYPGALIDNNQTVPNTVPIALDSYQYPASDSFDPKTDILVGQSRTLTTTDVGFPSGAIDLYWTRVVAHGYFTLKDFKGLDNNETISKVVFTAQDGANLTGDEVINVTDGSVSGFEPSNSVILDGTNLSFVTEDGKKNLKVWLSVMPVTLTSLDVVVETNKATYHKSWSSISKTLKGNARNTMGINMADAPRQPKDVVYYWVRKDLSSITADDEFVIVGKLSNGSTYAMSNNRGTSNPPQAISVSVSASGDKLTSAPAETIQWHLTKDGSSYTFYPKGSTTTWLYCTNTNNGVRVGTNSNKAFTLNGEYSTPAGYLRNTATSRVIGVYNSSTWRCYSATGQSPTNIANQTFAFYVKVTTDVPSISFTPSAITVNIGERVSNMASTDPSGLALTYSSSNPSVASVDSSTGEVTGIAKGTATITATFEGNPSYSATYATCVVTVVDPIRRTITFERGTTFTDDVTDYTHSFVNTCDGIDLTLTNIHNGGSENWTAMRAGGPRNTDPFVATITTNESIPMAIKTVTLSITRMRTDDRTKSVKLLVSSTSDFAAATEYTFNLSDMTSSGGDVSVTIPTPAANMYYKIVINLTVGNEVGHFRFNKIVYSIE